MKIKVSSYATVLRDGFFVPIIGVSKDATQDQCHKCKKTFHLTELQFNQDNKLLCSQCRRPAN